MRKAVVEDTFKSDRVSFFQQVYQEMLAKYPFTISVENGKLMLLHRRLKLVQIVDSAEDRGVYKELMYEYADYCRLQRDADINPQALDIDEAFSSECLHYLTDGYPMFFGFNSKNELVGLFGFRKSINLKTKDGENVNLQEISIRTRTKRYVGLAIYGEMAFAMLYGYAMKHNTEIFMSTLNFFRATMFHAMELCKYNYITTCSRYVDVLKSNIELDLWTTHKDEHIRNLLTQL